MLNPLVSVIIAVKNGERFLAEAINSILAQDYQPFEIIVVDGQSTDRTAEIAHSFKEVRYIRQVNKGVSNAYNLGIEHATGEFVAFLSHDDVWLPNKLSLQVGYLLDHPAVQYTTAKVEFFLEPGHACPPGFRKELLEGEYVGHIMETLVARKAVFEAVGAFNPQLSTAEDVDWFARAKDQAIATAVIPKVLLRKRVHNMNTSLNTAQNNQNLLAALKQSIERKRQNQKAWH